MQNRLYTIHLTNFKSIRDSGSIRLGSLTVLIGANGSGKSSVVEGLLTLKVMVEQGLDAAMQLWRGVEHACHRNSELPPPVPTVRSSSKWGMTFELSGYANGLFRSRTDLLPSRSHDTIRIWRDMWRPPGGKSVKRVFSEARQGDDRPGIADTRITEGWQFLNLAPERMMVPVPRTKTRGRVRLASTGENLAEYLEEIFTTDLDAFDAIQQAMKAILPYAEDVRSEVASLVEKSLYLALGERWPASGQRQYAPIPGWMMSTGTLRALAILAVLRHPEPPALLVVEEIENSLDPRTLALVIDEIRRAVKAGRTQVILTTHSPLLLDLVLLEHLIFVERPDGGPPRFRRPADSEDIRRFERSFSLGEMLSKDLFRQLT